MTLPVAVVLAGGASSRFWPLREKLLVEFGGRTLLDLHLETLRSQGWQRIVVVASPENHDRIAALAGPDTKVAVQREPLGMADALLSASDALADAEIVYVTQAHDLVDSSLHGNVLRELLEGGVAGVISASKVASYFPGGYLVVEDGRVRRVVEKPGAGNEPSDLVSIVAHVFASWPDLRERLTAAMAQGDGADAYERALSSLASERDVLALVYDGSWQALKYPWQLLDVMDALLERWRADPSSLPDGYTMGEDGVILGRDVRVFPGGHVAGPALIGHGSIIGNNALVRGSIVGPNCVVGFGSEVARSYLGAGVQLHHNYVGDSVLGDGCLMGWGVTTANFRLDGRTVPSVVAGERLDTGRQKLGLIMGAGAKIGVNTSTMPGVKIGAGALTGPAMTITKDVPDGARLLEQGK